jgi:hypothetical protein
MVGLWASRRFLVGGNLEPQLPHLVEKDGVDGGSAQSTQMAGLPKWDIKNRSTPRDLLGGFYSYTKTHLKCPLCNAFIFCVLPLRGAV